MNKPCNILIFPSGTEIAFEIFNSLKYSKFVKVFGGTSVQDHSQFIYENIIESFPFINCPEFIPFLNNVIDKYEIDYVYPAHDSASVILSKSMDIVNAKVVITDFDTVNICRSKKKTYEHFKDEDFIPNTFNTVEDIYDYPIFVKPEVGEGSKGACLVDSSDEMERLLKNDPSLIMSEYLPGVEYSVDCFTDKRGKLLSIKLRTRERIKAGISVRSRQIPIDKEIAEIAKKINNKLNFIGAWFFQVKKCKNKSYKLMEISPRIPGTMGLSRNCGINYPMLSLFTFWGYDVGIIDNKYEIVLDRAFYSSYKIQLDYQNIYIDYDDTLIINDHVNKVLLVFLYQAKESKKNIHILSKHNGDIYESMQRYNICVSLFDSIKVIDNEDEKSNYIVSDSIFIDDSFIERKKVKDKLNLPVFDVDMVESLLDWRMPF